MREIYILDSPKFTFYRGQSVTLSASILLCCACASLLLLFSRNMNMQNGVFEYTPNFYTEEKEHFS